MNLFSTNHKLKLVKEDLPKVKTPLGNLSSIIKINEASINANQVLKVISTEKNSFIYSWDDGKYKIECLLTQFNSNLPPGKHVDVSFAFIWRIKALENVEICLVTLLETNLIGSPDSGEWLVAQSFEDGPISLFIGTEDEEAIVSHSENNNRVPSRFSSLFNADNICYVDRGIAIHFSLLKGEEIQIQFLSAWSSEKDNEISPWFAVEQSATEILKQTGFY